MSSFQARARLRGEVSYYRTTWLKRAEGWFIEFLEGPHKNKIFPEIKCVIAKDDKYLLGGER